MKTTIGLAFALLMVGCRADVPMKGSVSSADSDSPIDPRLGRVNLGEVSMETISQGGSLRLPQFSIGLQDADYVEVVRCAKSYRLAAPNGKTHDEIDENSPTRTENLRYALAEAKANVNACRILGTYVIRETFQDITAEDGSYYYIVNPCVRQERSTIANLNCSYNISVTGVVDVAGSGVTSDFVKAAAGLAEAEARLSATMQRMYRRIELLKELKDTCDQNYITASMNSQILKSVLSAATIGLQMAAGAVFGPVGGFVGGQFFGALRGAFAAAPSPQYKCPRYDAERAAGAEEYKLLEPQLRALSEARAGMSAINGAFKKLDESILQSVRPN
jgi:hypothetical protein